MKKDLIHRVVRRRRASAAVLAMAPAIIAVLVVATGFSSTSFAADSPAAMNVDITKFMFGPKDITVAPGTTVRWVNHDEVPHTVASQDKSKPFASKAMDTDDKYEFTFTKEGDFGYICTVHPFMTGVVHVHKP
jgi:plastocyanin